MGLTIEVYAAEPQELVAVFSQLLAITSSGGHADREERLFDQLDLYPKVVFPSRLLLSDNLDHLCTLFQR